MAGSLLERAYRRLGPRYLPRAIFLQLQIVYAPIVGSIAGLSLFVDMSTGEFLRLSALGCALQAIYSLLTRGAVWRLTRPIRAWLEGTRSDEQTVAAWRAAACLPWQLLRDGLIAWPTGPFVWVAYAVWSAYLVWELGLPAYTGVLVYVTAGLLIFYASFLRYFGVERIVRPVVQDIAAGLPEGAFPDAPGLSLRARLLFALPAINVITAVVTYGLVRGGDATLAELLRVILIGAGVAATISLVLTVLLARSISEPIGELRAATRRVGTGDFSTRVPVITTDETGELARSFNEMTNGLAERERIRETFGAYVDPEVAEHILSEGPSLAGEQVEVTVMFLDVRDFTAFAERVEPAEVVATLNRLFELVVPIVGEHGGHVDKFVGDGLLAVFGAPRRRADHADEALAAACEIAEAVRGEFGDRLQIGLGLNSGAVVAGNVGGAGRVEFSVIGDVVNVAARVESATRETGDTILISEHTRRLLGDAASELHQRPKVPLKGKREEVGLYAPSESAAAS